ncbi:lipopolysaccharide-induced tumor necrosis factor-alpha factor homolog [Belonocnema kinseyi]|uniref:lipopolysaccharide-induced tumor necrosis factor-alpha factor homolog n=1 Tax=Belonocnema kinseyi TaxID=2817044 RepID=UPI00143DA678|nr:lipopolysaccharide-induced tumor necrosis factor-alpha factor homolog [Belonocnema kinseyi]
METTVNAIPLGPDSTSTTCPNCGAQIMTVIKRKPSKVAYIISALFCVAGCCICAFVPCCMKSCKDVHHTCPNCETFLGKYEH